MKRRGSGVRGAHVKASGRGPAPLAGPGAQRGPGELGRAARQLTPDRDTDTHLLRIEPLQEAT
jgi:hypothetical protein